MNKKIIAFSGTHGCGKTTMAYQLCTKMKMAGHNVVVLDELARRCPFKINQDASFETQIWLVCKQITEELELTNKYDYVIVDRSVYDSICYDQVVNKDTTLCEHLLSYVWTHVANLYKSIYVPDLNSFNYQIEDGTRDMDSEFRTKVYDTITRTYERNNVPHKIIHSIDEVYKDLGLEK